MEKPNRPLVPAPPMPAPLAPVVIDDDFVKSRILTVREDGRTKQAVCIHGTWGRHACRNFRRIFRKIAD